MVTMLITVSTDCQITMLYTENNYDIVCQLHVNNNIFKVFNQIDYEVCTHFTLEIIQLPLVPVPYNKQADLLSMQTHSLDDYLHGKHQTYPGILESKTSYHFIHRKGGSCFY